MRLLRQIENINILIGKAIFFLIWIGIVVLCWEVVARYVFGSPTIWAHGYTQRIFGTYFVLVGA
jgi:TRAP-type mannitol/chloroaromatic compound transport system permease small subunit